MVVYLLHVGTPHFGLPGVIGEDGGVLGCRGVRLAEDDDAKSTGSGGRPVACVDTEDEVWRSLRLADLDALVPFRIQPYPRYDLRLAFVFGFDLRVNIDGS